MLRVTHIAKQHCCHPLLLLLSILDPHSRRFGGSNGLARQDLAEYTGLVSVVDRADILGDGTPANLFGELGSMLYGFWMRCLPQVGLRSERESVAL